MIFHETISAFYVLIGFSWIFNASPRKGGKTKYQTLSHIEPVHEALARNGIVPVQDAHQ
jgi:hypothetical protein